MIENRSHRIYSKFISVSLYLKKYIYTHLKLNKVCVENFSQKSPNSSRCNEMRFPVLIPE